MPVVTRAGGGGAVSSAADVVKVTTDDTVVVGSPVYQKASGAVALAAATSRALARVLGLSLQAKAAGGAILVVVRGPVERSDWTAVAGTATLTPGVPYWLDTVSGKITGAAPTGAGDLVSRVGRATSTTVLDVQTEQQTVRL